MKLVRYGPKGLEKPGALDAEGRIRDLSAKLADLGGDLLAPTVLDRLRDVDIERLPRAPGAPRLGCCVIDAPNVVGVGLNYAGRAARLGVAPPEEPAFFTKATSALAGPFDPIPLPATALHADFEVELAVVIGRPAYRVAEDRALDHVAGYALANDLSERSLQAAPGGQWFAGKSLPGFAPLGPWLATVDEIANPQDLRLWAELDGQRLQDASTADMIFSVAEVIGHLSYLMELRPGDVILTGTPAGVGLDQTPARFLAPGSRLTLGADGLGVQRAEVVRAAEAPPVRREAQEEAQEDAPIGAESETN